VARIELQGVTRAYPGGVAALDRVSLAVEDGELLAVVGPSGSGKTTLLRLIAGLDRPDSGSVRLGGVAVDDLPPHRRDVALVFQEPALLPHLSVADNIAYGLHSRRLSRVESRHRVESTAALLGITPFLRRRPAALSGGERRRVALGRALAKGAGVILLDEPLTGLDGPRRLALRAELAVRLRAPDRAVIVVTHDQAEALALGDRVAVLLGGRLAQVATPAEVYDRPATRAVAAFIGNPPMNLSLAEIRDEGGHRTVAIDGLSGSVAEAGAGLGPGPVVMGVRPEHVALGPPVAGAPIATVRRVESLGHEAIVLVALGPRELAVRLPPHPPYRAGDPVSVRFDMAAASWFDPMSGNRLGAG